jgi:hypothetical protein
LSVTVKLSRRADASSVVVLDCVAGEAVSMDLPRMA